MNLKLTSYWPQSPRTAENAQSTLPGQADRSFLTPLVHRILGAPHADWEYPTLPTEPHQSRASAYWDAALYCLRFLLGWQDAGAGLRWWWQQGYAGKGDAVLEFVRAGYQATGMRDAFALWAWQDTCTLTPNLAARATTLESFGGPAWLADYAATRRDPGPNAPLRYPHELSANPLHLGFTRPTKGDGAGTLVQGEVEARRAVVLADDAAWLTALGKLGAKLPSLGEHSWHVDVVSKPLGWIGTFRRSRVTGLWFTGKHSIHMAGNWPR